MSVLGTCVVDNDVDGARAILESMKGDIYSLNGVVYVNSINHQIWTCDKADVDYTIKHHANNFQLTHTEHQSDKNYFYKKNKLRELVSMVKMLCPRGKMNFIPE